MSGPELPGEQPKGRTTEEGGGPAAVAGPTPGERLDGLPSEWTPELRRVMARITAAGCLAMVYLELTSATPRTDLLRELKASYQQFGVMEAIPPAMLLLQFVSGMLVHRLRARKPLWIFLLVTERVMAVPFALLPFLFRDLSTDVLIWCMIGCLAIAGASANLGVPLWFSWMSDILPHRTLGEFWARRRRWLQLSAAGTLAASATFFWFFKDVDIRTTYLVVATVGAVAGVVDILLFLRIPEPRMEPGPMPGLSLVLAPYRNASFRRFIFFMAYWSFAATFGFAFFRLYMLKQLEMDLWTVQVVFGCHAIGGIFLATTIGRMTDRFGARPVIVLCSFLKSLVVISLFFAQPGFWGLAHLAPMFVLDNVLNTGFFVATNNYMLQHSPRPHRSMYVAAVLATSGLVGAAASFFSGRCLDHFAYMEADPVHWLGVEWTNFHIIFAISILLRWGAIPVALAIQEPKAEEPGEVLFETIMPAVIRWMSFPMGIFTRGGR
jgi:MFS family permease